MRAFATGVFTVSLILMFAGSVEPQANKVVMDDLLGDWMSRTYQSSIERTRSPLLASRIFSHQKSIRYAVLSCEKDSGRIIWGATSNFHEGVRYRIDGLKPADAPNTYVLVFNKEQDTPRETENDRIVFPDGSSDALTWVFDAGMKRRINFGRVKPSLDAYVNHMVIAGTYTDPSGKLFEFTDGFEAKWPDKTFKYTIGMDCVLTDCDYIIVPAEMDGTQYRVYGYEWKQGKLYLYKAGHPGGGDHIKRNTGPLYVLTPKPK
jgi:hypothetical protein